MLASLYNGNVHVWNHETQVSWYKYSATILMLCVFISQSLVKSFEVTDLPVRAAKFVVRKSWIVTGSVCGYV